MIGLFVYIECVVLRISFLITAVAVMVMLFLSSREAAVLDGILPTARTFAVAVHSQESAVGAVMVMFVQRSRLESIDVAAVEVCSPLLVVVVPSCGR